ncbi:MAG: RNA polymerase factor sigma-54 [Muribaculaceae bacterium]|nr:RNA polymerase factor sigma-54 [Muribaculaceae bacterium]
MAKQGLILEQKQTQRLALEQQRMLGMVLEKNDAEMAEFIDNKVNEIQALEKKSDDNDEYSNGNEDNNKDNDRVGDNQSGANDTISDSSGDDDVMAWYRYFANNRSRDDEYYSPTAVNEKTLQEFLTDQLGELELDETQQVIARAIVGNIEDNGYLRRSATEIADDVTFNDGYVVDAKQVEEMIATVQSLDPPGIAARGLQECMRLQLERKPKSEDVDIALTMVTRYFDELAAMNFETMSRRMNISAERLEEVFRHQIRRGLNPYPGNAFGSRSDNSQQVTPDFDVELDEDNGRLTVTLRNNIPALQISESYALMMDRYKGTGTVSVQEAKEKKQIQDAYVRASMFIEVLKQRQETLFGTMSAIVQCQRDYFMSGDERDLKPLGQQQIADMIGKDVSVVSRAVSNKYVQLPWGVKSLKSFFSEDINGSSRHEVYDDLKKLVDGEDKKHPLSDDALCDRLKAMGYKLERRTVAKYRDSLKIPSSTVRRKMAK